MKNEFVLQGFIVFENLTETRGSIMIKPGGFQDTVDAPMVLLTGDVFQQYKDEQFRKGLYVKATIKIQSYVNDVKMKMGLQERDTIRNLLFKHWKGLPRSLGILMNYQDFQNLSIVVF